MYACVCVRARLLARSRGMTGTLRRKAVKCHCVHVQPSGYGFSTLPAKCTKRQRSVFCTYTACSDAPGTYL